MSYWFMIFILLLTFGIPMALFVLGFLIAIGLITPAEQPKAANSVSDPDESNPVLSGTQLQMCPKCYTMVQPGKLCSCGSKPVPLKEWVDAPDENW